MPALARDFFKMVWYCWLMTMLPEVQSSGKRLCT